MKKHRNDNVVNCSKGKIQDIRIKPLDISEIDSRHENINKTPYQLEPQNANEEDESQNPMRYISVFISIFELI